MTCNFLRIFFTAIFLFLLSALQAQSPFTHFEGIQPRNIGPAGMSGRVTAIDVDMSDKQRIFVGTASGGLWLSENGGISWNPIFDESGLQSIGAVKINQANPSEIWVGTGEGNPRNSQNSGAGIYYSNDGGKSWAYKGLKETRVIHRIVIDESKHGVVYAGVQGSAWGPSEVRGVYKTSDYGASWNKVLYVNESTGVADMIMDPVNPNKIMVAMWEFGRKPWTFQSGGKGSGMYMTLDGGAAWKQITDKDGLPKGDLGRIGIAMSRSKPRTVYALIEAKENALYKSVDGGYKWTKISTHENIGNRPFYYSEIYVDPQNENRVYSLWSYVSKSEDGGKTFDVIADYGNAVHPDHHAFWIDPEDPSYLIDGNDGGLAISRDMGLSWRFVNNLPVGQFYHVNVDRDFPYHVYGGMQDNGSWVGPSYVLRSGPIVNHDWQEVFFGDGFDVAPLPENNRMVYAMSQGGNLGLVDKVTGKSTFVKPNHPEDVTLRFNWNAALALDPFNNCGLYYGSQFVHYSSDCGASWSIISPDLTTNDTLKQKQDVSGGLTIDATNAENNTTIISIAPSSFNSEIIWVGTDDGRLQLTLDGGASWTDLYSRLPDAPAFGWIPQIELSKVNSQEAFVVVNNYRMNDWSAYLYHTSDMGGTWRRLADDSQVKGFVTSVTQDATKPELLFLGTDVGLYISYDKGSSWHHFDKGLPPVQIRDMKIQPDFDDLVLGTFGRAFWVIDDIGPFRKMVGEDYTKEAFSVLSVSPAYLSQNRSYQGIRFYAQGEFRGDNKDTDAMISLWINPDATDKNNDTDTEDNAGQPEQVNRASRGSKKQNQVSFTILDTVGDTIRRFTRRVEDKGLVRMKWGLEMDGVRGPSRRDPSPDADLPGGGSVMPGSYKVLVEYAGHRDSVQVQVKMDPRIELSDEDLEAMRATRNEINALFKEASAAYDRIKKARKQVELVESLTATLQDSIAKKVAEMNKQQKKDLDMLDELFMDKPNLKGIQRNPNNLMAFLFTARRYSGAYGAPGPNARIAFEKAGMKLQDTKAKLDTFFDGPWSAYTSFIQSLKFEIFKE